jgi:F-type H+-transporting ATPase subunit gamma
MKLVAASRLRKAQVMLDKSGAYADLLKLSVRRLLAVIREEEVQKKVTFILPELLRPKLDAGKYMLLVFSSDRGLCGSYNQNIGKAAVRRIKELEQSGKTVRIVCFGRKAYDILKKKYADRIEAHYPALSAKGLAYADASELAQKVEDFCQKGNADVCEVLYSRFRSAISRDITVSQVWPLSSDISETRPEDFELTHIGDAYYDIKPDAMTLLDALLPQLVVSTIFSFMVHAQASEQGARMAAMDNATRNAKEMIGTLTLKYNSIRQSAITTELTEIISGAEAL